MARRNRTRRLTCLGLLALIVAAGAGPASANYAQYYLCKAALALGSASARADIFSRSGDAIPPSQLKAIADHLTDAANQITEAEKLFGEPFVRERTERGTGREILRMIDDLSGELLDVPPRRLHERIDQIFSKYLQGVHYTFVSSRQDSFQWNANCDTQTLRTCFNFGKAVTAAASAGTDARPDFVNGYQGQANEQMLQAIQGGLAIAMDPGARPPDGHAKKICCGFGSPAEWEALPHFTRETPASVYLGFLGVMLNIFEGADVDVHGVCGGEWGHWPPTCDWCPTDPHWKLPPLDDARVYESPGSAIPRESREYRWKFDADDTRYVYWELIFDHLQLGLPNGFRIDYTYFHEDGRVFGKGEAWLQIGRKWQNTSVTRGLGWKEPGGWEPGRYRIELTVGGEPLSEVEFEIVEDLGTDEIACPDSVGRTRLVEAIGPVVDRSGADGTYHRMFCKYGKSQFTLQWQEPDDTATNATFDLKGLHNETGGHLVGNVFYDGSSFTPGHSSAHAMSLTDLAEVWITWNDTEFRAAIDVAQELLSTLEDSAIRRRVPAVLGEESTCPPGTRPEFGTLGQELRCVPV